MIYWDKNTNTLKLEKDVLTPDCLKKKFINAKWSPLWRKIPQTWWRWHNYCCCKIIKMSQSEKILSSHSSSYLSPFITHYIQIKWCDECLKMWILLLAVITAKNEESENLFSSYLNPTLKRILPLLFWVIVNSYHKPYKLVKDKVN